MPALNEEATIAEVVRGAAAFGDVVVVDDGSWDKTAARAREAGAKVVSLPENRGYEGALEAGFAEAARREAEVAITMDADGQFDPVHVGRMLEPIKSGRADLVLGQRPVGARFAERLFSYYTRKRHGIGDILCGVKAYSMPLYRANGRFDEGRSVGTELALAAVRKGARFELVELPVRPRQNTQSRFGQGLRANLRLLTAMRLAVVSDLRSIVR
ncbi:MAG: glycosyltransferase family 2 protein [Hyphomicrobium sp.]